MKRKAINLLSRVPKGTIVNQRRAGNSTRLIDLAVDLLFKGEKIKVVDHYATREANKLLLDKILKRLQFEHHITSDMVLVDRISELTIELHL